MRSLTGTTTPGSSRSGSNGNEGGELYTQQNSRTEALLLFWWVGALFICWECSWRIWSPVDRVIVNFMILRTRHLRAKSSDFSKIKNKTELFCQLTLFYYVCGKAVLSIDEIFTQKTKEDGLISSWIVVYIIDKSLATVDIVKWTVLFLYLAHEHKQ